MRETTTSAAVKPVGAPKPRAAKPRARRPNRAANEPAAVPETPPALPEPFAGWFAARGWTPRPHQLALVEAVARRRSTLLIAPTGAGKTLAGFLPSLLSLADGRSEMKGAGLHTLYISPLKALAVDVARNVTTPIDEMGLAVRTETRTGDTPVSKRQRQRIRPPEILMTTPEQLTLLLSHADSVHLFADLDTIILDELHALTPSKRGDLLALDIARLRTIAPGLVSLGLSATVRHPSELRAYLVAQRTPESCIEMADLVRIDGGAQPQIKILELDEPVPFAGHTTLYAVRDILEAIESHGLSLVFVNTRRQAELLFQELWRANEKSLPIALHHGSLDATQRRKVEAAMAAGRLKAVVATSTLDLGIDWGDIDLVIHVGAPKGASRFIQRIGRANHRLDEPSRAVLVPSNRFEVLECRAAVDAALAGAQDVTLSRKGALDVLAQHVLGTACAGPFDPAALYAEVVSAAPYAALTRATFDRIVEFAATGGYALKTYDRFAKLKPADDGRLRLTHPRFAESYRLNAGTIVAAPLIKVRLMGKKRTTSRASLAGGRIVGEVDEYFIEQLRPGDAFVLAGEVLRFEGLSDTEAFVTRAHARDPIIPAYNSGKFPLSTHLAERVRAMLADADGWTRLPTPVAQWLEMQQARSIIPARDEVLIETFPHRGRHYLVGYPFEGRLAHQTLGMLLTRRLDRAGAQPLGFVANDYGIAVWGLGDVSALAAGGGGLDMDELFAEDMLGDDLEAWLAESNLMKRTFRQVALIAGLIERRHRGREKTGRQVAMSTNLVYDVLRRHDPHHILLEAAWADAATGLLDIARLGDFLRRVRGRIRHQPLDGMSPLSIPIMLEIGREAVAGFAREDLLREAARTLQSEAARGETSCSS
jgi:ATP-dependent helicase Lhr and Lhr-like helicase